MAANGKAGRPRNPRAIDVLTDRVEGDIERWIAPYEDALLATRGGAPDHSVRLRAAEAILDRAYGKPTQRAQVELDHGDRTPAPFDYAVAAEAEAAFNALCLPEGIEPASILPSLSADDGDAGP